MTGTTVAIVGAGIGGVYLAADLGLRGCPIRLHDRDDARLGDIRARGGTAVTLTASSSMASARNLRMALNGREYSIDAIPIGETSRRELRILITRLNP